MQKVSKEKKLDRIHDAVMLVDNKEETRLGALKGVRQRATIQRREV